MEENHPDLQKHSSPRYVTDEHSGTDEEESLLITRELVHERLAREMMETGMVCEPMPIGASKYESGPYLSHLFPLGSLGMTNRGIIRVSNRPYEFVQILQRG